MDEFFVNFGCDFLFGRPDGPKAPPRVDFGNAKKLNYFKGQNRDCWHHFKVFFFGWILHEISVAILRFLGPRWEENPAKIASKSVEKIDRFLYASWNRFFDFLSFSAPLGTRKTSKHDRRGAIFFIYRLPPLPPTPPTLDDSTY